MADLILWLAFAGASAPVLLDMTQHIGENPWAIYVVAFPPISFWLSRREPLQPSHTSSGLVLAMFGVGIQLWAIASSSVRNGRPGLVLFALGVLLIQGRFNWRIVLPVLLCIPVPSAVLDSIAHWALPAAARGIAALSQAAGFPALAQARSIEFPGQTLTLIATDLGICAALLAFGLAWFLCSLRRRNLSRSITISTCAAVAGWLTHLAVTCVVLWMTALRISITGVSLATRTDRDLLVYAGIGLAAAALAWRGRERERDPLLQP